MARPDHYAVLGVEPMASAEQIASAYRRHVRALHPDAHPDRCDAERSAARERLDDVVAAYGTLRDPDRRAAYDEARRAPRGPARRVPAEDLLRAGPTRVEPAEPWARSHPTVLDLLWEWTVS
ncbi:J domain-containing protein [Streptomyces sp. CB03234]|uniref:J domain-containing protein n=1 Tax=Streptomyces sp. (strain CB03234) TaxID=1703937 RepID=UPI00093F3C33|nr:J domain-containing protein [Streptomyces sp. CB03234]